MQTDVKQWFLSVAKYTAICQFIPLHFCDVNYACIIETDYIVLEEIFYILRISFFKLENYEGCDLNVLI